MELQLTVDELFVRPPSQWGLRGDPRVWEAMAERLRGRKLPADFLAARRLLEETFTEVARTDLGERVEEGDTVFRKELTTGSGISDGSISLHFWKFTGLPILIDRWAAAVSET